MDGLTVATGIDKEHIIHLPVISAKYEYGYILYLIVTY